MDILVVDPGKITGYGFLFPNREPPQFVGGELEHYDFLDHIEGVVGVVDAVVCESFHISQRTLQQRTDKQYSIGQIEILRWWCERKYHIPFTLQSPADAKRFATDEKLQQMGWYKATSPGEKGHRRDAARHALLYGINKRLIDPRRLLV